MRRRARRRTHRLGLALLAGVLLTATMDPAATALGQEPARRSVASPPDAGPGDVLRDPDTGERYRTSRPPEGLRRGSIPVPAWVPVGAGAAVALLGAVALAVSLRRRARPR